MRSILIILFLSIVGYAQADQLAYISKEKAEETAAWLNKGKTVYLFCGCCAVVEPEKVKVLEARAMHTGYEDYWEVEIKYQDEKGEVKVKKIDLAYVWKKGLFGSKTLGAKFNMSHDACVPLNDWDNPKYVEKDI